MGSGKTTVGTLLAARSGREFVDNDRVLYDLTCRTAREIEADEGLAALHQWEQRAVEASLAREVAAVIAVAASVVEDGATRRVLARASCTVWLTAPVDVLVARVSGQTHRPLEADVRHQLAAQMAERSALFARVADIVVDSTQDPAAIVDEVLPKLRECDGRAVGQS